MMATSEELEAVLDVGPVVAASVRAFFDNPANHELLDRLRAAGVNVARHTRRRGAATRGPPSQTLSGVSFVLTGTLSSQSRDQARRVIESHGGKVASSVSRRTGYVVVGVDPGSKAARAEELGVSNT